MCRSIRLSSCVSCSIADLTCVRICLALHAHGCPDCLSGALQLHARRRLRLCICLSLQSEQNCPSLLDFLGPRKGLLVRLSRRLPKICSSTHNAHMHTFGRFDDNAHNSVAMPVSPDFDSQVSTVLTTNSALGQPP